MKKIAFGGASLLKMGQVSQFSFFKLNAFHFSLSYLKILFKMALFLFFFFRNNHAYNQTINQKHTSKIDI